MDTSRLFRVDGIVAVVTGGGSGIGFTMAQALAGAGAKRVYILGRRREVLETAATTHPSIVPIQCDITDKASLRSAVDFVTKDVGYINIFIANSGILGPVASWNNELSIQELQKSMFKDVAMADFTQVLHVNTTGTFYSVLAFLELLDAGNKQALKGGFGAPTEQGSDVPSIQSNIIVTSSISSFSRNAATSPAYLASKAGLTQLAKQMGTGLAKHGIRVNVLAPGLFHSEMISSVLRARDPSKEPFGHRSHIPARKFGGDDEMAGTILYLASKAGSFCNGLVLVFDGGRLSIMESAY